MLQNYFIPHLKQLDPKHDAGFEQDRAPWHFDLGVKQFLNRELLNRLIGRNVTLCIANDGKHVAT